MLTYSRLKTASKTVQTDARDGPGDAKLDEPSNKHVQGDLERLYMELELVRKELAQTKAELEEARLKMSSTRAD